MNKVKEVMACGLVLGLLIVSMLIGGYSDTHYSVQADVYRKEGNSVYLIDGAGYIWELTDRDDLMIGQSVKLKFYNNTTDYTRTDDEIVGVRVLP